MDNVYILTLNGEIDIGHGDYIYLIGAFESELLATEEMKSIIDKHPNKLSADDFELNCISMNQVKVWHL